MSTISEQVSDFFLTDTLLVENATFQVDRQAAFHRKM
jgi:hypothetical protein